MTNKMYFADYLARIWMDFWLSFPIVMALGLIIHDDKPIGLLLAMLGLSYILGLVIRFLTRRWPRYPSIFGCLLFAVVLAYSFNGHIDGLVPVFAVYNLLSSLRGIAVAERDYIERNDSTAYYLAGAIIYLFAFIAYRFAAPLKDYQSLISYVGIISAILSLGLVNRDVLIRASGSNVENYRFLKSVKRNNRILFAVILVLVFIITGYGLVKTILAKGLSGLIKGLRWFFSRFFYKTPVQPEPQDTLPDKIPLIPEAKASPFWDLVFEILFWLGLLFALAVLIWFIVKLLKKYLPLLLRGIKILLRGQSSISYRGAYRDEKESLIDLQSLVKNSFASIRDLFKKDRPPMPRWRDMTNNRQRVRYIYYYIVKGAIDKGHDIGPAKTPSEVGQYLLKQELIGEDLVDGLVGLYGRARYSDSEIQDLEVQTLVQRASFDPKN